MTKNTLPFSVPIPFPYMWYLNFKHIAVGAVMDCVADLGNEILQDDTCI